MKFSRCLAVALLAASAWISRAADPAPADSLAPYTTAEALWKHLEDLQQGPETRPETQEQIIAYISSVNSAAQAFVTKYPKDEHVWEAKMLAAQTESTLANMGQPGFAADKIKTVAREISEAKDAPEEMRHDAAFTFLAIVMQNDPAEFDQALADFVKKYPDDDQVDQVKFIYARKISGDDPAKARAMLSEVARSKNASVAEPAASLLKDQEMLGKPVDIKFKGVNGEEVDLAKMKGKVVLVDFWATWCGPCMKEVPMLVELYKKFHDKGFEIVGISVDQSRDQLLQVMEQKGITWPQYFDEKEGLNDIAARYGVTTYPRMWLIDRAGNLVNVDVMGDLEPKVEKLLGGNSATKP